MAREPRPDRRSQEHSPVTNQGGDQRLRSDWGGRRKRLWPPDSLYHHHNCACMVCNVEWRTHVSEDDSGLTLIQSSANLWLGIVQDSLRREELEARGGRGGRRGFSDLLQRTGHVCRRNEIHTARHEWILMKGINYHLITVRLFQHAQHPTVRP